MEAYYVIIFLCHAAIHSIKSLVFSALLHSKSQKMKEKNRTRHTFNISYHIL